MPALDPAWSAYAPADAAPVGTSAASSTCTAGPGSPPPGTSSSATSRTGPAEHRPPPGRQVGAARPGDFAATADLLADAAVAANEPGRLKAWWVYRMLFGPDPLGERLTLCGTTTSPPATLRSRTWPPCGGRTRRFRKLARGTVRRAAQRRGPRPGPALWLDAPANRKGHPNENLARELMELFTLGIGHYTEADVKEAARALTGWTVEDGKFAEVAAQHDDGEKTILGKKGDWTGSDLRRRPARAPGDGRGGWPGGSATRSSARRPCRPTADRSRWPTACVEHDLDVGWAVGTILRSQAFFADANLGTRVMGPVEFVVGAGPGAGAVRPAPEHAGAGRLVRRGWARTCSTRRTSAAGPAAGLDQRPRR